jgi:hypothetical protein
MHLESPRSIHRTLRRALLAAAATAVMWAVLLVGAGAAAAAPVTAVTFSANSYVSANPSAVWTVGFTPSAGGALTAGNAVFVEFDGFNLSGPITATLEAGFAGTCTSPVDSVNATYVVVTLPAGCSLAAATPATLTITGIQSAFNQYSTGAAGAFRVLTYTDSTFSTPIDTSGTPSAGGLHITAQTTYSSTTSSGGATGGGTPPATTTNTVADTTVTVAGNPGALTLAGHAFAGWCTTSNAADPTLCTGVQYAPAATFAIAANTTLYSVWTVAYAADGSGTNVVSPTSATAGSTGNTLTFTYNAATNGMNAGAVHITVPAGWSAPSAAAGPGCTTSSAGTLAFTGQTIEVTGLTLPTSGTLTVTYGATTGGACTAGSGATAQATAGTATFTTTQKSTAGGTLTALATSPVVTVTSPPPPTCTPGFWLSGGVCVAASPGYYVDLSGAIAQRACPKGAFSKEAGSRQCTDAPAGSFVGEEGSASATACAVNTFTAVVGASACQPCPSGASTQGASGATGCTVVDVTPPVVGKIALTVTKVDEARVEVTGTWDRDDIASWRMVMLLFTPAASGDCAPTAPESTIPSPVLPDAAGPSLPSSTSILLPGGSCVAIRITARDAAGNSVSRSTAVVNTTQAKQAVKVAKRLAGSAPAADYDDRIETRIETIFRAYFAASTTRFSIDSVKDRSSRAAAPAAPAQMFKVTSKRVKPGVVRVTTVLTKAGRAYLAKRPALRGKRVRMSADFVIRLKAGSPPITVRQTFMMRMPK